ncbi:MAG: hypothetical protein LN567_05525 [Rickettsia endosymbiont of Graphium doson]|nr:hypothetical protein [Rickettsia endosymbiont of Graphium doson]
MTKKKPPKVYKNVYMTHDYLYEEGKKFYQEAINIEFPQERDLTPDKEKNFNAAKETYFKAILYFQGAMLLGSKDACAYLNAFYNKNHLGIDNQYASNLIKMLSTITKYTDHINRTNSIYLKNFGIISDSDLKELAFIETGIINIASKSWDKIPVPEYLILTNIQTIIRDFNNPLPPEGRLITNISVFDGRKEVFKKIELEEEEKEQELLSAFTILNNDTASGVVKKQIFNDKSTKLMGKNLDLLDGAVLCTIS